MILLFPIFEPSASKMLKQLNCFAFCSNEDFFRESPLSLRVLQRIITFKKEHPADEQSADLQQMYIFPAKHITNNPKASSFFSLFVHVDPRHHINALNSTNQEPLKKNCPLNTKFKIMHLSFSDFCSSFRKGRTNGSFLPCLS